MLQKHMPHGKASLETEDKIYQVLFRSLDRGYYTDKRSFAWAGIAFSKNFDRGLPRAHRAHKNCERQPRAGEEVSTLEEAIPVVAKAMRNKGLHDEALICQMSLGGHLRIGEWLKWAEEDIIDDGDSVGLVRGVIIDSEVFRTERRKKQRALDPGQKCVPFDDKRLRIIWRECHADVGLSWLGPRGRASG